MRTLQRRRHKRGGMYATLKHEDLKINGNTGKISVPTPPRTAAAQVQSDFDREYEAFIAEQQAKKKARLEAEAKALAEKVEEPVAEQTESPVTEGPDIDVTEKTEEDVVAETVEETVDEAAEPVAVETKKSRKKKAATAE